MIKTKLEGFTMHINVNGKDVASIDADPIYSEVYFNNKLNPRKNYVWYNIHPGKLDAIRLDSRVVIRNNRKPICWVKNDKIILLTGGPAIHVKFND